MKQLAATKRYSKTAFLYLTLFTSLLFLAGCDKDPHFPKLKITTVATGLENPMGIETDKWGNIWVVQSGNGNNNNGKVVVITKDGTKYDAIVHFETLGNDGGDTEGPSHLLYDEGWLYILGARGKMYVVNVSSFTPGDTPLEASSLTVEDIGKFVLAYPFVHKTGESHPYNLTKGSDGDIYITDAAANAIIHRKSAGVYSVLAEVPSTPNPTPVGPPQIEAVPTGIICDGQNFLVSTLTGFPFLPGQAFIYQVSKAGTVSVYQKGFTSLVDIAQGNYFNRLAVEYGTFGATGFAPKTGRLVWANGSTITPLATKLNLPVGLKQVDPFTWYVTTMGDGSVVKITYF